MKLQKLYSILALVSTTIAVGEQIYTRISVLRRKRKNKQFGFHV